MPYQFLNNTYSKIIKDDSRDRLNIEIGDSKQPDFYPQLKVMRWDNEVNVSIRLLNNDGNTLSSDNNKIFFSGKKQELNFYELLDNKKCPEGGYAFDVILKEKPLINKIEFSIVSKGVDFFYQPPLNTEKLEEGQTATETDIFDKNGKVVAHCEDNIPGSYAVYCSEERINWKGGKLYRAGKVGHIYRPKIIDANGNWIWGDLLIESGLMTVTIPQEFLDKAIYPILIDPEFGVTTRGGAGRSTTNERGQLMTLSEAGTVTELHGYSKASSGTVTYNMAVYDATNGNASPPTNLKGYTAGGSINTTAGWHEYAVDSEFSLSASGYFIVGQASASYSYYTDSGGTTCGKAGYTYPFSDPHGTSNYSTSYKISLHAVYSTSSTSTVKDIIGQGFIPFRR